MADSVQLPAGLLDTYELKPKSDLLRRFLIDVVGRVQQLEKANADLAARVKALEGP